MSRLPSVLDDFHPTGYHHSGSGYHPNDLWIAPLERLLLGALTNPDDYLRPHLSKLERMENKSHIGKDGFEVCLHVENFQPDEISVKAENNTIVVKAKHEEKKDDHGHISRGFTRRYELPKGFKVEDVTSSLSSDGILSIKCPNAPAFDGSNVRQIQIQQTGPAKLSVKNDLEKNDEKSNL